MPPTPYCSCFYPSIAQSHQIVVTAGTKMSPAVLVAVHQVTTRNAPTRGAAAAVAVAVVQKVMHSHLGHRKFPLVPLRSAEDVSQRHTSGASRRVSGGRGRRSLIVRRLKMRLHGGESRSMLQR